MKKRKFRWWYIAIAVGVIWSIILEVNEWKTKKAVGEAQRKILEEGYEDLFGETLGYTY